jgi:adenine-specific DNA-methyltransferase
MNATTLLAGAIRYSNLLERLDVLRLEAHRKLTTNRAEKGQFFTPQKLARFMARMFAERPSTLHILDAGAGIGSLSAALVIEASQWVPKPSAITVTAYEIDPTLVEYLHITLDSCQELCRQEKISFSYEIVQDDFIRASVEIIRGSTLFTTHKSFNAAILNPPYKKINTASTTHRLLQKVGIETTNMYTAFLWLAIRLMEPNGELVAITPRSFCNGPYFLPFRKALLETMSINRLHIFDYRDRAFKEDDVLQENVILHATKSRRQGNVIISSSADPDDPYITVRKVDYHQLVYPDDPNVFIHIVPNGLNQRIGQQARSLLTSIDEIGITVSTGKVIDFRAIDFLTERPDAETVPLIYPSNFSQGYIAWPNGQNKKPSAIRLTKETENLLVPAGWYVLVKRFSAKEEKRRIVAAVCDPARLNSKFIGIENHLNYYHQNGRGLPPLLAKGLAAFLNSTLVDEYFRQFSGHTQVNAADLRSLKYPSLSQLFALGEEIGDTFPKQEELDQIVLRILGMDAMSIDLNAKKKIEEALTILRALQIPKAQLNQRSALTLLALLDMKPNTDWRDASNPLRGITEMMDYFREHFGISYAPNTRETVRRSTVHQFVQMGLVIANPDDRARPVNSPKTKYQIDDSFLKVIRTYGTSEWDVNLKVYLKNVQELRRLREKEREMALIPVTLPDGREVKITAGGQNDLIKQIIEEFCPRYTPGGRVIYIGDAGDKFRVYEQDYFASLGIIVDEHSKMPDVIVHLENKNWLVLIEAVTSHGPIDIKRRNELKDLFKNRKAPLVFVTAFPTRKVMMKYLQEIAWETEVWVAEAPSHLIHFNGERFLGPYDE